MPIANYSDLQSAVADWMARSDLNYRIPDFIALAEGKFNRVLRTHEMMVRSNGLILTAGVAALPATYVEWVGCDWVGARTVSLMYREPDSAFWRFKYRPGGDPQMFTILANEIHVRPIVAGTVNFTYYQAIPPLASNATNWLLTKAPDLYLSTVNAFAAEYINNAEKAAAALMKAENELQKAVNEADVGKVSRRPSRAANSVDLTEADNELGL